MTSTSYPQSPQDWQGRFIANMAASLARRSDVDLSLWAPPGELPALVTSASTASDAHWMSRLAEKGGMAQQLRTHKVLAIGTVLELLVRLGRTYRRALPDLAHVNWLQNALPLLGTRTPTLITVLGTDFSLLRFPAMKLLLRVMLKQRRAILAPNADWMCPVLKEAFGDLAEIRPVAFGVDKPWFELARVPPENGIHHWLAITRLTRNKIGDLFTWGEGLFDHQRQLHLFGPMQEQVTLPPWTHYHGPTYPAELLQDWFPKACGLITLSRHDEGRPQVMLEAMAAGLPILATDLPAHRDLLQHRTTGWVAATRSDLGEGLAWLEDPLKNAAVGHAARQWVKEAVGTWDDCADRYAVAYSDLLRHPP